MNQCKNQQCQNPVKGDRLYCDEHNQQRIRELGGDPLHGNFRNVIFTRKPDLTNVVIKNTTVKEYLDYGDNYIDDE